MESANLHPHGNKVQEQYLKYSSLGTPTSHQVSTIDEWNQNLFPNIGSKYNRDLNETISKSRDPWQVPPLIRTSMNQDSFIQQSASEFLIANIKDEMSDSFPKLSEMMYHHPQYSSTHHDNLWHSSFPISNNMTELQLSSGELQSNDHHPPPYLGTTSSASRYDFNHIFQSTSISTSDLCSTLFSSSLDLNLKSLDLLTSTYDGGSCNQSLIDIPGKLNRSVFMGHESLDHRREHSDDTSTGSKHKVSAFVSGTTTSTKRPGSFFDTKESTHTDAKKHRSSMSRSPCPTLKTDTATVLSEAIGYIQFLHDQVQTLSVPFMKSSQSKFYRTMQGLQVRKEKLGDRVAALQKLVAPFGKGSRVEGQEEQKRDLRSRGLCLVPQSSASYFINSCTGGV
ncbi:hypothetical protein GOBAR_AA04304 [Gossypium barbadense]|uniref:BHLH domain-containing protein n=1 Tax=Gossypium barbadense TaxID=3634 RepID=A0A2P5YL18_GOSBA|nr:hypothetical protein GOBAR_AA04304 [Gossypium barbadense]